MPLTEQVLQFMRQHCPPEAGRHLIVGCSGGPDSLALAHLLVHLRSELEIRLILAHLDHGLRSGSGQDADRVRDYAARWAVPVEIEAVAVAAVAAEHGESIEMAGRRARYAFFARLAQAYDTRQLALGHQRQDQAETVLLNLLRGTGPRGLGGMRPDDDWPLALAGGRVLRPLLAVSPAAIEHYLRDHQLQPVRDPSNRDPAYLRNRVRHRLLPLMKSEFNQGMVDHLWQLAELIRDENGWLEDLAQAWLAQHAATNEADSEAVALPLQGLQSAHVALRRRIYRLAFRCLGPGAVSLTFGHVEAVDQLVAAGRSGAAIHLPGEITVQRSYEQLTFRRGTQAPGEADYHERLPVPGSCTVSEAGLVVTAQVMEPPAGEGSPWPSQESLGQLRSTRTAYLDYGRVAAAGEWEKSGAMVPPELTVRNRRPGDRFQPLGMSGHKKIKDFFIDEKVAADRRDRVPLVVAGSAIIWVVGHRIADPFRVRPETGRLLRLDALTAHDEASVTLV